MNDCCTIFEKRVGPYQLLIFLFPPLFTSTMHLKFILSPPFLCPQFVEVSHSLHLNSCETSIGWDPLQSCCPGLIIHFPQSPGTASKMCVWFIPALNVIADFLVTSTTASKEFSGCWFLEMLLMTNEKGLSPWGMANVHCGLPSRAEGTIHGSFYPGVP